MEPSDANQAITYMKTLYGSSPYLTRYPEEWNLGVDEETTFLQTAAESERKLMLGAFHSDRLVGLCDISPVSNVLKLRHRCVCALSVHPDFQNQGLGTLLLKTLIFHARKAGFEQVELEVVSENKLAIHLYEQLQFEPVGIIPHGFKTKEGKYQDLLLMVCNLE